MNNISIKKSVMKLPISVFFILLSACTTFNGVPTSVLDSPEAKDLLKQYTDSFITQASHDVTDPGERNTLISKALIIMDTNYAEFVNSTETDRKGKDMATDIVELSMNLAGAAVGSAGTKTILAAISAGVNGINGTIDKDFFYKKTFSSLVARMNADRKTIRARIVQSMIADTKLYPWHTAVNDLIEYYNAGTLLGAISSIQKEAGEDEHKADEDIKLVRYIPLTSLVAEDTVILHRKLKDALKQFNDKNFDAKKLETIKTSVLPGLKKDIVSIESCGNLNASSLTTALDVGNVLWKCLQGVGNPERNEKDRLRDLRIIEQYFLSSGILTE
ncbi:MAG: hypothetical protein WC762_02875 [Methylobacter sp.]